MASPPSPSPSPAFAAIVVAAGRGARAGNGVPKQFRLYRGKPLLRHAVEHLLDQGAGELCLTIPEGYERQSADILDDLSSIRIITGGITRQQSVRRALETFAHNPPERILIHDAARPTLPPAVTQRLLAALKDHAGAIPVLPIVDSLVLDESGAMAGTMAGTMDRDRLKRVQTPQAFRFAPIWAAHRAFDSEANASDDAQILRAHGGQVALVEGDERLRKITFAHDFEPEGGDMRIGQGYDVHALAKGEELWLCGLRIAHDCGLAGHSDADVALHAVVDALLGAISAGDIGTHFPPADPRWKDAASSQFVEYARTLVSEKGYRIANLDLTLVCEAPKIAPHAQAMRANLAQLLRVNVEQVSIKATTSEGLGFTGRREGIAAQAAVLLASA